MPDSKLPPLELIIGEIYEAATDPDRWHTVVRGMEQLTGSDWGMIWWRDDRGLCIHGINDDFAFMKGLLQSELMSSEYTKRFDMMPDGQVVLGTDVLTPEEMKRTLFYQELGRYCDHLHVLGAVLRKSTSQDAAIGWSSGEGREPYRERDRALVARLMPHIRRSVRLSSLLEDRSTEIDKRDAALNSFGHGIVLIDRKRRILFANQEAERHFLRSTRLRYRQGRLAAANITEEKSLHELIGSCLGKGRPRPLGGTVVVRGPSVDRPLVITGTPLSTTDRLIVDDGEPPAVVLFIVDLGKSPPGIADVLGSAFALTKAEARLVESLTHGTTTSAYAEANGVKPDTVRKHLKTIFQKTDTKGQTDLVALASRLGIPGH